jgi:single-stranded DNA-specific DHH superfamily exonuclease
MDQMMNLQLAKQHREEMLREVELNRQAKALRAAGKGRAGRRSALVWEMKWHAGRLLKLLGTLKNAG